MIYGYLDNIVFCISIICILFIFLQFFSLKGFRCHVYYATSAKKKQLTHYNLHTLISENKECNLRHFIFTDISANIALTLNDVVEKSLDM